MCITNGTSVSYSLQIALEAFCIDRSMIAPYIPPIDPSNASDTQNFDETFLEMNPTIENEDMVTDSERERTDDDDANPRTDGEESVKAFATKSDASQVASAKVPSPKVESVDVFDGYSFKGRHSVLIDEEDDGYAGYDEEEPEDDELADAKRVTDALAAMHGALDKGRQSTEDTSETKTIDLRNEGDVTQQVADAVSVSASPTASTVPDSAVTASITTDDESVVAPKVHKEAKRGSENSEATTNSSAIPSLTIATTAATTPSGDLAESPLTASDSSSRRGGLHARIVSEGSLGYDDALRAPLPLSPVIEAVDPETGRLAEDDSLPNVGATKTPLVSINAPSPVELASPVESRPPPVTPIQNRTKPSRREKSGVEALDRLRRHDDDDVTEREEDDWDFVETPGGEDRNGAKGASLWQRGVVDRYRLAVFRKGNTPRVPRSTSAATYDSVADGPGSPSPSSETKHRRGRTNGLSLRKSTKEFLRTKSPSATYSSTASRASLAQASAAALTNPSGGLLTPSPSGSAARPKHSLKSKSSALSKVSVNSPGSSDQSTTDLPPQLKSATDISSPLRSPISPRSEAAKSPSRMSPADELEKHGNLNLKKMKKNMEQGAEKMLSLFGGTPRHQHLP